MLAAFVGPVDVPAAGVLIAFAITIAIVATTFLTTFQTRDKRLQDFERAKLTLEADTSIKLANAKANHEATLARIASEKDVNFRRIDSGMIDVKMAASPGKYTDDSHSG